MVEELKQLLTMFTDVSEIAGWVIGAFFLGKLIIWLSTAGMTYKLIHLGISKLHDFLTKDKKIIHEHEYEKVSDKDFEHICITSDGTLGKLQTLLQEHIVGKRTNVGSPYIHRQSVQWLKEAILAKEKIDAENPGHDT